MKLTTESRTRCILVLVLTSLLVSGCSDGTSIESEDEDDGLAPANSPVVDESSATVPSGETENNPIPTGVSEPSSTGVNPDVIEPPEEVSEPGTTGDMPDPIVQNDTEILFSITVPAVMSNTLELRLVWGDENFTANWVGDESWSVSAVFPTDTQHPLVVTFSDGNGALVLGTYESTLRTGTNAAQTFEIEADQFDTDQWDSDNDGVSNIGELIAGADPLVNADLLLEIEDFYTINSRSGISVTRDFESRLTDERPFFEDNVVPAIDPFNRPVDANDSVDIDADGNGTHTYEWDAGSTFFRRTATRTHTLNSIAWEGVKSSFNSISGFRDEFISTVTVVDENTREFVEEISGTLTGDYSENWQISTRLTGILIEGSSMCEPVAGTGSLTFNSFNPSRPNTVATFSKAIDNRFWRVVEERIDVNGEIIGEFTNEYFARELKMLSTDNDTENGLFICEFVDI